MQYWFQQIILWKLPTISNEICSLVLLHVSNTKCMYGNVHVSSLGKNAAAGLSFVVTEMYVSSSKVEQETPFFIFFLPYMKTVCMPIQLASSHLNLCFQRKLVLATSLDTVVTFERLSS